MVHDVTTVVFFVDIVLNFFTSFRDAETQLWVRSIDRVVLAYLRGWFLPDLISTMPPEVYCPSLVSDSTLSQVAAVIRRIGIADGLSALTV